MGGIVSSPASPASRKKQLAKLFATSAPRPSDAEAMAKLKKLLPSLDSEVANACQPEEDGGRTVLMVVISLRMGKEVGQYLVEKGADLTAKDTSGYTVLHWAAMKDDTHWATKAMEAGVGINQLTNGKQTALMFACKYQSMEVFRLLVDRGADATIVETVQNNTALSYAREVLDEADSEDERQRAQEMIRCLENATSCSYNSQNGGSQ
eukprot:gnl/TRDRNA2_/TRDRNA2_174141_c1_seq1.p1 gnl/TRDRNA2_/TRDRNA2_174141_c1~~gnl/TRDRNA2_/TRDRNA2_174141_c1_seq1.p1  ORF type:complete len:208 (-),score=44.81 gnl/TRDRNA2_/TRDRNA2_174141_c1_seq1:33-656(-)